MADDNEFVVDRIVSKRLNQSGKVEYLVKWKGFADTDNTWESMTALHEDCRSRAAITTFESQSVSEPEANDITKSDTENGNSVPHLKKTETEKKSEIESKCERHLKKSDMETKCRSSPSQDSSDTSTMSHTEREVAPKSEKRQKPKRLQSLDSNTAPKRGRPPKKPKLSPEDNKYSDEECKAIDPKSAKGFDRNLEAERICGMTDNKQTGELMFLVKWKGVNSADLVPAKLANQRCPQVVIQFYESNIHFK